MGKVAIPPPVITTTFCVPAFPAGVNAEMEFAVAITLVAGSPPTVTLEVLIRLAPLIVISVPPRVEPEVGVSRVSVGTGET